MFKMNNLKPNNLRNHILDMVYNKKSGHIGGSFSLCEIISYLYLNYDLINKDKLILSKGHAVPVIYAVLYELGYLENLDSFREIDSELQGHPDKNRLKYLHASTGSLGQGLSIAIGHALASKLKKIDNKIFCIVGDGEIQEGQIWEAFMFAPKYKLNNLICLIDHNKIQSEGFIKDILNLQNLQDKIKSFGWDVLNINGHDYKEIKSASNYINKDYFKLPVCIILNTIKGKGVSFMENNNEWHSKIPSEEEYNLAKKELNESNT